MNADIQKQIDDLAQMKLPALQARFAEVVGEPSRSPNKVFLMRRITEKLTAGAAEATAESAPTLVQAASVDEEEVEVEEVDAEDILEDGIEEEGTEDDGPEETPSAEASEEGEEDDAAEEEDTEDAEEEAATEDDGAEEAADDEATGEDSAEEATEGDEETTMSEQTGREETTAGAEGKPLTKLTVPQLRKLYVKEIGRATASTDKAYLVWKLREARKGRIPVGPRRERGTTETGEFMVLPFRLPTPTVKSLDQAWKRLNFGSRSEFLRAAVQTLLKKKGEAETATLFEPQA